MLPAGTQNAARREALLDSGILKGTKKNPGSPNAQRPVVTFVCLLGPGADGGCVCVGSLSRAQQSSPTPRSCQPVAGVCSKFLEARRNSPVNSRASRSGIDYQTAILGLTLNQGGDSAPALGFETNPWYLNLPLLELERHSWLSPTSVAIMAARMITFSVLWICQRMAWVMYLLALNRWRRIQSRTAWAMSWRLLRHNQAGTSIFVKRTGVNAVPHLTHMIALGLALVWFLAHNPSAGYQQPKHEQHGNGQTPRKGRRYHDHTCHRRPRQSQAKPRPVTSKHEGSDFRHSNSLLQPKQHLLQPAPEQRAAHSCVVEGNHSVCKEGLTQTVRLLLLLLLEPATRQHMCRQAGHLCDKNKRFEPACKKPQKPQKPQKPFVQETRCGTGNETDSTANRTAKNKATSSSNGISCTKKKKNNTHDTWPGFADIKHGCCAGLMNEPTFAEQTPTVKDAVKAAKAHTLVAVEAVELPAGKWSLHQEACCIDWYENISSSKSACVEDCRGVAGCVDDVQSEFAHQRAHSQHAGEDRGHTKTTVNVVDKNRGHLEERSHYRGDGVSSSHLLRAARTVLQSQSCMLLTHQEEEDKDNPLEAVTVVGVADAQDAGVGGISPEPDCEDDTPHSHRRQPTQQQEQGSEAYQPLFTGPSPQHMSLSTVLWPQFNALSTVYREASTRFTRTLQRSKQSLTSCWEDTILFVSSSLKLTGDKNRDKNSTTESTALASNGCAKLGGLSSLVRELVSTWTVPSMPVVSVAPVLPHTQHFQAEVDVQQDLQQDLQQRQSIQHRQQYRGHEHRRKISDSGFWEDWPDEVGVDDLHNHRQPQQHQQPHQHQPQYPFTSFNDTTDYLQPLITIDSLYNTTDTAGSGVATPPVEPATNAAAQTASIMGQSPPPPRELPAPAQRTESNALSAAAMHGTGTQPYDDFSGQLDWPACDDIQSFLFDSGTMCKQPDYNNSDARAQLFGPVSQPETIAPPSATTFTSTSVMPEPMPTNASALIQTPAPSRRATTTTLASAPIACATTTSSHLPIQLCQVRSETPRATATTTSAPAQFQQQPPLDGVSPAASRVANPDWAHPQPPRSTYSSARCVRDSTATNLPFTSSSASSRFPTTSFSFSSSASTTQGPTSLTTGSSTLDSTAWRPLLRTSSSSSSSSSSSASWPSNEHGGLQQRQHKRRRTRHCRAFPPPPRVYEEYGAYMAAFMAASPRDKEKMLRDRRLTTDRYAQLRYWAKRVDPTHHAVLGAYRTRMNNRKNKRHQRQRERAASTAKSRSRNPMPNLALKELAATIQGGGVGWSSGPSMFPVARSPQASPFFEPWQAQTASSFFGFANTPGTRTGRSQSSRPNPLDQELPPCDPQWLPPRSRFPQEQQEAEEFAMAFDVPMM